MDARGYETFDDPIELRVALRELHRVRSWIGQFADVTAELPGYGPEGVQAVRATAAMVGLLIERAEAQLDRLTTHPVIRVPAPRVQTAG